MKFDEAIAAHVNWKTRLRACIEGIEKLNAADVSPDNLCALGKWIHGEGAAYSSLPEYPNLKDHHAAFHKAAAEIVSDVNAGRKDAAAAKLDDLNGDYAKRSTGVVSAIRAIRSKASSTV